MMTDTNPPADRTAAEPAAPAIESAARIRAYLARFPNMKTVGPEVAHDPRDAIGNPYALPISDLLAVLDGFDAELTDCQVLQEGYTRALNDFGFEMGRTNELTAERDAALARVEELEGQLAKAQAELDSILPNASPYRETREDRERNWKAGAWESFAHRAASARVAAKRWSNEADRLEGWADARKREFKTGLWPYEEPSNEH
jgi:hypothetical protein